ncbi:uncharacterized protein LOC108742593 [Agrilus planipennis]|uniref:Uncharacterized protein LOC108742593 n=1 Tax=Agrilus planipennis TaxID=224129 RepID=A0A1W4XLM0_AGRPL|nr:uncharacterized protein LOC108742593 [Agrilus planipennis]XP_018333363.1 uncharacterized protein LOC108742593 [Agrilus planipennis]
MSRRLTPIQHPTRVPHHHQLPTSDNPYQGTTLPLPHTYTHPYHQSHESTNKGDRRGGAYKNVTPYDTGVSEESFTDSNTYYNCNQEYSHCRNKSQNNECVYSDDSGSTRLPYYEEISPKRHSRNYSSDRNPKGAKPLYKENRITSSIRKDVRKVYPNQSSPCEAYFHDGSQRHSDSTGAPTIPTVRGGGLSRLSDRPQSSLSSSGIGSAVVDGCGGRCQTFENVCYYFLQVAFTMGILIGTSLCIAGAVLRKSTARNLQVLVYIGALLSLVSALLLGIQCNARNNARKRKKALRNAKRQPIPLDNLQTRIIPHQQQPLMVVEHAKRVQSNVVLQDVPQRSAVVEQQGIPWWRRKDIK